MIKYFVDQLGNYIGAFEGDEAIALVPKNAIEIPAAPAHALQKWDGQKFLALNPADLPAVPLTDAQALEKALIKKGLVTKTEITLEKAAV